MEVSSLRLETLKPLVAKSPVAVGQLVITLAVTQLFSDSAGHLILESAGLTFSAMQAVVNMAPLLGSVQGNGNNGKNAKVIEP